MVDPRGRGGARWLPSNDVEGTIVAFVALLIFASGSLVAGIPLGGAIRALDERSSAAWVAAFGAITAATLLWRRATGRPSARWLALAYGAWGGVQLAGVAAAAAAPRFDAALPWDLAFLVWLPFAAFALTLLPRDRTPVDPLKLALDFAILFAAITAAGWVWFIRPGLSNPGISRVQLAIIAIQFTAAAIGVVVLLTATARDVIRLGGPTTIRLLLSAASFILAEFVWLFAKVHSWENAESIAVVPWTISFCALVFAAPERPAAGTPPVDAPAAERVRPPLWWVAVPNAVALVMLVVAGIQALTGSNETDRPVIVVGSLAVVALVIVRQALTLRESERITHRLTQQVDRDPLTGLLNHRKVHERLERELAHARACGHPVGVALIDIDDFKAINDAFGHQAGDAALRALAGILTRACRGTDIAARYAGDEFMLVLPGLDAGDARTVGDRLLSEIARPDNEDGLVADLLLRVSIGFAITRSCETPARQLVGLADLAMYEAKAAGKNRLVVIDADRPAPDYTTIDARSAAAAPRVERALTSR